MEKVSDRVRINELHDVITRYRAVMEQVLVVLEHCNHYGWMLADYEDQMYAALTALREALKEEGK